VGGGLSGGLIAAALALHRPELSIQLIETGPQLGGNHRWSWFASDLSPEATELMGHFRKVEWDGGYDVGFPAHIRRLHTPYRSLSSDDFDDGLRRLVVEQAICTGRPVIDLEARKVVLEGGLETHARAVIDCRGMEATEHLTGGWQLFMGRHVRTRHAHGVERPVIMDATVAQLGGYRFVYVLPLGSHDIFVEDTYYADSPELDRSALSGRIDAYCAQHSWTGDIIGSETGVLPVITGGNFARFQAQLRVDGVSRAGARGGFVHPLTSYTLPQAAEIALAVARDADLPGEQLAAMLEARARTHWGKTRFYRRLGAMLFGAARPQLRYRMFERFYRMPEGLIERFYACRSTRLDRMRILCGKPPVPLGRALTALTRPGPALAHTPRSTKVAA